MLYGHSNTSDSRRSPAHYAFLLAWLANLAILAAAIFWTASDPILARHLAAEDIRLRTLAGNAQAAAAPIEPAPQDGWRTAVITLLACTAVGSLLAIAAALFFGPHQHRRTRSWLAFTALVAVWLALVLGWRDVAWAGQRWRIGRQIAALEPVAARLREHWPKDDGTLPVLGPFMAYTPPNPQSLLLLKRQPLPGSTVTFSAVEHSPAGGLRFQFADEETGAWLEWHPPGEAPASFTSDLETRYTLVRSSPLSGGWHLTRYAVGAEN